MNLVGIYLRAYIFYKDCVLYNISVAQATMVMLAKTSAIVTGSSLGNGIFSNVLEIMNNLTALNNH